MNLKNNKQYQNSTIVFYQSFWTNTGITFGNTFECWNKVDRSSSLCRNIRSENTC